MALRIPKIINVHPTAKHTATLLFFHGSDIKEWIDILNRQEFRFSHIKIVYPTAPSQPYTPLGGMCSNVWFDRHDIAINVPENIESVDQMCRLASDLIDDEVKNGIPEKRIVVGGFSMGGALAMHLAYRYRLSLAGCVGLSNFLNDHSAVYETLKKNKGEKVPLLLQFHGLNDTLVPFSSGETTYNTLQALGVQGELISLPKVEHELVKSEIIKLRDWIMKILPEK